MMRLELPVRWEEQDKDADKYGDMIKPIESKKKYSYGRLSICAEDIGPYYDIDSKHTMINDKLGKVYCVCVPFDQFKKIYTETTGQAILAVQSVDEYNAQNSRNNGKKDDFNIDDILDN